MEMTTKPELIMLDVYDTMLDMHDVHRRINSLLDYKRGYQLWFEMFMEYTFVNNCMQNFHHFLDIAAATLKMTAQSLDKKLDEFDVEDVFRMLNQLPVNEDAQPGLSMLKEQNFRLGALTNVPKSIIMERMERTGLISYFDGVYSAEEIRKYKPNEAVYKWAAKNLQVDPESVLMVSVHSWDLAGAQSAGFHTAFIQHDKQMIYPLMEPPELVAESIIDLSGQLSVAFPGNKKTA